MKLIILDRDGVINQDSDAYIKSLDEWIPLPGSIDAIARLSKAGWTVAVATNQSGIGRGYYDEATLQAMHDRLRQLVAEQGGKVDLIRYCPHAPDAGCDCRKPLPGLFRQIADDLGQPLNGVHPIWYVPARVRIPSTRHCPPVRGYSMIWQLLSTTSWKLEPCLC